MPIAQFNPHTPDVSGISEVNHDDRPDSAHEEEVRRAGGESSEKNEKRDEDDEY